MKVAQAHIAIWPGTPPGQPDPTTHFWYESPEGGYRSICNDSRWPVDTPPIGDDSRIYVPCADCRNLYVEDIVSGESRLDTRFPVDYPHISVVYSQEYWGYPQRKMGSIMEIKPVAIATFARFYGATGPQKVKIVRDARLFQSDPKGYGGRDYYANFRNALKQTHWQTNDIKTFEGALDSLVEEQRDAVKQEHYRELGESYIRFWKKKGGDFFAVPTVSLSLAGLTIRVATEVGMKSKGDTLALKLLLSAPAPTRGFRQAIQHLTSRASRNKWPTDYQALIWDVRREEILTPVSIPKDLHVALQGQAMAFQGMWESLDSEE